MHVDIDAELAGEREDAADLPLVVGVVIGRRADHSGAALQCRDEQLLGAGVVGQPLLRKDADFEVDRPAVFRDQRQDPVEAAQAHPGVELDMRAHARRAEEDAFFERAPGALVHVLDREALLDRGDARHGLCIAPALGRAAVDDARLVEMDVGLDKAGAEEPPGRVVILGRGRKAAFDGGDAPLLDADVDGAALGIIDEDGVSDDEIHDFAPRQVGGCTL